MARDGVASKLELKCKFGKLVCSVVRDDGYYREFAIDLYRDDGKMTQVCVVGTNEDDSGLDLLSLAERINYRDRVHVFLYDGENMDSCGEHYVEPYGEGWVEEWR